MSEVQTLDESMEETLSEIRASEAEEIEEVEAEPTIEEAPSEETPADEGPARDEKGQFAEKDPESEGVEQPEIVVAENLLDDDGNEIKEYVNPPSTWRALAKSTWNELSPTHRAEIHKREQDSMRGVEMLKEDANYGRQINSVVAPYMPTINARGSNPTEAIGTMLNAYYVLETAAPQQKAQQLWETAKQYGVVNEMVALYTNRQSVQPQGLTQQDVDRTVDRTVNERLAAARQQATEQLVVNEVQQFETAMNADGTLKHPYFENVRQQMASIVEAEGVDLETAYEREIWANPKIRPILMSEQAHSDSAKRQDQATAHVEKAKKALDNNLERSGSHSVRQPTPTGSVDDTMAETMAEIRARS